MQPSTGPLLCVDADVNQIESQPTPYHLTSNTQSRHNNIQPGALRRSTRLPQKRPRPNNPKLILPISIIVPNTIRIPLEEIRISLLGTLLLQDSQVPRENPFELVSVFAAGIWLARVVQDAFVVG